MLPGDDGVGRMPKAASINDYIARSSAVSPLNEQIARSDPDPLVTVELVRVGRATSSGVLGGCPEQHKAVTQALSLGAGAEARFTTWPDG